MHMIARVGIAAGVGAVGVTLTWVVHQMRALRLEIQCERQSRLIERVILRREIGAMKTKFTKFREEIEVRLMIRASVKDKDPMMRSIFQRDDS